MCRSIEPFPKLAVTLLAVLIAACGGSPGLPADDPDTIFFGGRVVTVDRDFRIASAVAVREGRILAVGSDELQELAGEETAMVNLEGKTLLPGFNDNHIHLSAGRELQEWEGGLIPQVPEWTRGVRTWEELKQRLEAQVQETPTGEWIVGGLTRMDFPNQKIPSRWDLDEVSPNHPVCLTRGPHTWVLNSRALRLARIDSRTREPEGGEILRNEEGEPNGRLMDAAKRLAAHVVPMGARTPLSQDEALESMRDYLLRLASLGITSVNIAGVRPNQIQLVQELYERWGEELPRATMQVRLSPGFDSFDDLEEGVRVTIQELEGLGFVTGFGNDRLKLGAIKMSIDGGLSAPVFWSTVPYESRPDFSGVVRIPAEAFYPVAKRAHELGWQLGIHAIGDAAVVMVVDQVEKILAELPRDNHRHYIHHVSVKPPDATIQKMADLGIGLSSQPSFTVGLGAFAVEALSEERERTQNPTKSFLDRGVWVSWGSDGAPYGPLISLWTGVTRTGWEGKVYGPEEAVSMEAAIRLHTMGSAYQNFDESKKGSIEVGKLADFVILGEDVLSADPDRIRHIPIKATIVGGREIFRSEF